MGKIIVSEFITLDGVIEAPGGENSLGERSGWSLPFFSEETMHIKLAELQASEALLMGRVTYQIHAAAWPSITDEEGFADLMNGLPKYVVSTTLETVEWNNSRLIRGDIPQAVKKLKEKTRRDILIDGSADLVNLLLQHDLIDEYRLLLYPVVIGIGKRLFREENPRKELRLVEARTLPTGVTALKYQPASSERSITN